MARQGNTTTVGLGWHDHQQPRKQAIARLQPGTPCPYCGHPMYPTVQMAELAGMHPRLRALDYDHVIPRALGGAKGPRRLTHSLCNRRAGQRLSTKIRMARTKSRQRAYNRW
jgi:5-methylcytosine-specific restriction endonuclease McrA